MGKEWRALLFFRKLVDDLADSPKSQNTPPFTDLKYPRNSLACLQAVGEGGDTSLSLRASSAEA